MRFYLPLLLLALMPVLASATAYDIDFECADKATGTVTTRISFSPAGDIANVTYKNVTFQHVNITNADELETQGLSVNRLSGQERLKLLLFKKLPANDSHPNSFRALAMVAANTTNSWSPLSETNVDLVCWRSKAWNEP